MARRKSWRKVLRATGDLLKQTFTEWIDDKTPQLGAALAYYTIFSLAPMILLLLAAVGILFRDDPAGAWTKIVEQLRYFLDPSAVQVIQDIARTAANPNRNSAAAIMGIVLALFGATGVFGQLQDALNTIWGVKAKPGGGLWGFIRSRFLSFALLGGLAFLLLVSLLAETMLKVLSHYLQSHVSGGLTIAVSVYLIFDALVVTALFAMIFKILPNARTLWRDVWVGSALTALLFLAGKWLMGMYFASGSTASAYGAASSLITLLLWVYYSSQILLFGAEFTQVYANRVGSEIVPDKYAVRTVQREVEAPSARKKR